MMKLLLAAAVLLVSLPANAISRYNSTTMSCDEVKGTIRQDGEAIMRYNSRAKSVAAALWSLCP